VITCLIADDHPAVLQAVVDTLEQAALSVVGTARDGREALQLAKALKPDVVLVDLGLPELSGLELVSQLSADLPETKQVVYTGQTKSSLVKETLAAGASGFVLKDAPLPDLVRAIEMVAAGKTYIDPAALDLKLLSGEGAPDLSAREIEVLAHLSEGESNDEIGAALSISPETVRTHIRKAMVKLEADTRTQAVAKALRYGLIG
jgi:DNA-binding NarL/FixJ family response regulator